MLLFAHTGITLGSAWSLSKLLKHKAVPTDGIDAKTAESKQAALSFLSNINAYVQYWDYRILLIGSLLPDIIDKPTSLLFPDFNIGRGFAHTLLFAIIILLLGGYLVARQRFWGASLAYSFWGHLILDKMWQEPVTLLWPLYGWELKGLEIESVASYFYYLLILLTTDRVILISEIIGFLILAIFFYYLLRYQKLGKLLSKGCLD